jgi:hypothetical protein
MTSTSCFLGKSGKMRFSGRKKSFSPIQPDLYFLSCLENSGVSMEIGMGDSRKHVNLSNLGAPIRFLRGNIGLNNKMLSIKSALFIPLQSYILSPNPTRTHTYGQIYLYPYHRPYSFSLWVSGGGELLHFDIP